MREHAAHASAACEAADSSAAAAKAVAASSADSRPPPTGDARTPPTAASAERPINLVTESRPAGGGKLPAAASSCSSRKAGQASVVDMFRAGGAALSISIGKRSDRRQLSVNQLPSELIVKAEPPPTRHVCEVAGCAKECKTKQALVQHMRALIAAKTGLRR
mmetsp:Transcript_4094/g.11875  ORF Transcript_4094/g.11875 Transcript_4094/m.11875 type:complete len:162 (+) Transcript_4094:261-746(+)